MKGFCIGATGNACKFRHYYNEMDALIQAATKQKQLPTSQINQLDNYSSPYRVKVVKEVSKQRKEEVDLETGKRKSWVETTEFEVLDLTGETPAKKPKMPLVDSTLKDTNKAASVGNNKKKDAPVKKSAAQVPSVEPGTCPVCYKVFKGERGVASHRRAKSSSCHPDKENRVDNQSLANKSAPVTPQNPPRRLINTQDLNRNPLIQASPPVRGGLDDSVIVIPDTPVPGNRRVSLRRSVRMV